MGAIELPQPESLIDCQLTHIRLDKGLVVYSQGEQAQDFYYLNNGLIGLYHMLDSGKESLVRLYQAKQYFGFRTFFGDHFYHCTARILQPAELIRIKPKNLPQFLSKNPHLATFLIKQLAIELQDAEHRLSQVSYQRSTERIESSIRFLTDNYPNYHWTYREIAEFAGCETETAIRISRKLKDQGLLKKD